MEIFGTESGKGRKIESLDMNRTRFAGFLAIVVLIGVPGTAWGQSSLDPKELPKSTIFYLAWHGTPSGEPRKTNSLLALWDEVLPKVPAGEWRASLTQVANAMAAEDGMTLI